MSSWGAQGQLHFTPSVDLIPCIIDLFNDVVATTEMKEELNATFSKKSTMVSFNIVAVFQLASEIVSIGHWNKDLLSRSQLLYGYPLHLLRVQNALQQ
jgi:hypothetical protein